MLIDQAIKKSTLELQDISATPRLDGEVLLLHALNLFPHGKTYNPAFLRTWPEYKLEIDQLTLFNLCLQERLKGKPIAYITGFKEFWSLNLKVSEQTLIPRADTETLVEQALALIPQHAHWNILDLGTGSGAIALAIAKERQHCHVFANDRSLAAITMAKNNALRLNINNCYFFSGDWLAAIKQNMFQLIVSNPPYIREQDPHLQQAELQYEPISALISTDNGLSDLNQIITHSINKLVAPAYLLLEHGYDQAQQVKNLLLENDYQVDSQVKDINGIIRVTIARIAYV